jgi:hypothetical protein
MYCGENVHNIPGNIASNNFFKQIKFESDMKYGGTLIFGL